MKITIQRDEKLQSYEVALEGVTLLEVLQNIKTEQDNTLTFNSGCRSGVCGSCAMRVNSKEVLACEYKVQEGDVIQALNNMPILRDLVVDMDKAYSFNKQAKAWQSSESEGITLTDADAFMNAIQSDCILCASCYSACPVYAVNGEFLGPFSLTRVWRYVSDKRETNEKEKIDTIQTNGIWECTLCNECTVACPQDISSKADIEKLRAKSAEHGYMDPSFGSFGGGFDTGFGFDF